MAYVPTPVPTEGVTADYLFQELMRVSAELELAAEGRNMPVRAVAPVKPREGTLAIADGVNWNPGMGAGLYEYLSGAWLQRLSDSDITNAYLVSKLGYTPANKAGDTISGNLTVNGQLGVPNRPIFRGSFGDYHGSYSNFNPYLHVYTNIGFTVNSSLSRLTATVAGYYHIHAQQQCAGMSATYLYISKVGIGALAVAYQSGQTDMSVTTVVYLGVGESVDFYYSGVLTDAWGNGVHSVVSAFLI